MVRPISVQALPNHRIYIEYSDGAAGEIDLSEFADRGVFRAWNVPGFFEQIHIGKHRQIQWNDEVELCPDALYMRQSFTFRHEEPACRDSLEESREHRRRLEGA